MTISAERVSRVIGEIYAAVGNPEGFTPVVQSVRRLINGSSGVLMTPHCDAAGGGFGYIDHFNAEFFLRYPAEFTDRDIWLSEIRRKGLFRSGNVLTNEMALSDEAFRRLPVYHETHVPMDGIRGCSGIIADGTDPAFPMSYMTIFRGVGSRPFGREECRVMGLLTPHLMQALRLSRRLMMAEMRASAAEDVLNDLECGIVLVDAEQRVLFMNQAAERFCSHFRGLALTSARVPGECRLNAVMPKENMELQRGIRNALDGFAVNEELPEPIRPAPLVLHGLNESVLLVTAMPLPPRLADGCAEKARAMLLIEDPLGRRTATDRILATLYGLTLAERRVASALLSGERPKEIAYRLSVSEHTVRSHIKSIYSKTSSRGMSSLIRLLTRLANTHASQVEA